MFEHGDETMERRLEGKWYISREIEESEISLSIIFEKIENLFFFFFLVKRLYLKLTIK